jgi:hypothetical protein
LFRIFLATSLDASGFFVMVQVEDGTMMTLSGLPGWSW